MAAYRYEKCRALALYRAGRSIILYRIRTGQLSVPMASCESKTNYRYMDIIRALLLLATFSSWQRDPVLVRESLEYPAGMRDSGLTEKITDEGVDWYAWAQL